MYCTSFVVSPIIICIICSLELLIITMSTKMTNDGDSELENDESGQNINN